MNVAPLIELTTHQRQLLEQWTRSHHIEKRLAFRATIILAAAEGTESKQIAADLYLRPPTVSKWRSRFATKMSISTIPPMLRD
ncbi:MAG: hypothetical protein U5K69_14205 [Balneolaceae bacterium]|nr:hypothetical protein [Balneolaceae bacterium]